MHLRPVKPPVVDAAYRAMALPPSVRIAGGCSSMVEQKPSKLTTRGRFPSPAPKMEMPVAFFIFLSARAAAAGDWHSGSWSALTLPDRLAIGRACPNDRHDVTGEPRGEVAEWLK